MASSRGAGKKISERRREKRDQLFPGQTDALYSASGGGWSQTPRTVPMIASLIDMMAGRENPGRLYVTLWAYEFSDGFVEVPDPAQLALEAGYLTSRAERTFSERIAALESLGFIRTAPNGLRDYGFVLLRDPHFVVAWIRATTPEKVPSRWWSAFESRCTNIGIKIPTFTSAPVADDVPF